MKIVGTALVVMGCSLNVALAADEPAAIAAEAREKCQLASTVGQRKTERPLTETEETIIARDQEACARNQMGQGDLVANMIADQFYSFVPGGGVHISTKDSGTAGESGPDVEIYAWQPIDVFVSGSEDMAWSYGHVNFKVKGQPLQEDKYIAIWIKQDGQWKAAMDARSPGR